MKLVTQLFLSIIFCFSSVCVFCQSDKEVKSTNFFEVQKLKTDYYEKNPDASGYKQWKRKEWFYEPRLYPSGEIENLPMKILKEQQSFLKSNPIQRSTHGSFSFLGPYDHINDSGEGYGGGKGRINSIAFHPTNAQIIYAGTSSGGLWKTENGGTNWSNISPRIPLLAIADVVVDQNNPNHIYIATGDPEPLGIDGISSHDQTGRSSMGLLRSTNGGLTWSTNMLQYTYPSARQIFKLIIHPTNSLIQFAATSQGILYTNNAWATLPQNVSLGQILDIEFKPGNPNIMYASGANFARRSVDGGLTWSFINDPAIPNTNGSVRTKLAVSPDNPNAVYLMMTDGGNNNLGIVRSLNSGANNSWTVMDGNSTRFGNFGFYCVAFTVDPNDVNRIYAGKQFFGTSANGGLTNSWATTTAGHADIHDLQVNNGVLYCANDGGLYTSTNFGTTWTEISQGIGNSEIYRMSGTPQNSNLYVIGAQDIGSLKRTSNSTTFETFAGADGMTNMIDYTNSNIMIISGQNGNFFKTTTGGPAETNITPGIGGVWVTPAIMDPVDPTILFVGKDSLFRSNTQGDSWTWFQGPAVDDLNVIAQGTNNRNRLYASEGSNIWTITNALSASGNTSWTDIDNNLPNRFITDIVVNPNNSFEVFITFSGFGDGDKVYKTNNAGATWINISGSLPNVPINCINYHDDGANKDNLYIGTDIGVFFKNNDLSDWIYFSNDLPTVPVTDMYINNTNNTIAVSTYGRGLWRSNLYTNCLANITLTTFFGFPSGGVNHYSASNTITSTRNYYKDIGTDIRYNATNYIDLEDGFDFGGQGLFIGIAGEGCN